MNQSDKALLRWFLGFLGIGVFAVLALAVSNMLLEAAYLTLVFFLAFSSLGVYFAQKPRGDEKNENSDKN
jgi:hypothetical protein